MFFISLQKECVFQCLEQYGNYLRYECFSKSVWEWVTKCFQGSQKYCGIIRLENLDAGELPVFFLLQIQKVFKGFDNMNSFWLPYKKLQHSQCFEEIKANQTSSQLFGERSWLCILSSLCSDVVNNGQLEEWRLTAQGWIPTSGGLRLAGGLNQRALYTPAPMCCWFCSIVRKCFQPAYSHI